MILKVRAGCSLSVAGELGEQKQRHSSLKEQILPQRRSRGTKWKYTYLLVYTQTMTRLQDKSHLNINGCKFARAFSQSHGDIDDGDGGACSAH